MWFIVQYAQKITICKQVLRQVLREIFPFDLKTTEHDNMKILQVRFDWACLWQVIVERTSKPVEFQFIPNDGLHMAVNMEPSMRYFQLNTIPYSAAPYQIMCLTKQENNGRNRVEYNFDRRSEIINPANYIVLSSRFDLKIAWSVVQIVERIL
jgi:hypothetical protein